MQRLVCDWILNISKVEVVPVCCDSNVLKCVKHVVIETERDKTLGWVSEEDICLRMSLINATS